MHVVLSVQRNFTFSDGSKINEIIKAGSLGHGTAVFGDFDVDLVIYSDGMSIHYLDKIEYRLN